MKKKKVTLEKLKLQSFITSVNSPDRLNGGRDASVDDGSSDGSPTGCP